MREVAPGVFEHGPAGTPATLAPSTSMAKAVIAMSRAGITEAQIDALIAAMPEGQTKTETGIWWRQSNEVQRDHPAVALLGGALGLTSAQIDDLFTVANSLA